MRLETVQLFLKGFCFRILATRGMRKFRKQTVRLGHLWINAVQLMVRLSSCPHRRVKRVLFITLDFSNSSINEKMNINFLYNKYILTIYAVHQRIKWNLSNFIYILHRQKQLNRCLRLRGVSFQYSIGWLITSLLLDIVHNNYVKSN